MIAEADVIDVGAYQDMLTLEAYIDELEAILDRNLPGWRSL